MGKYFRTVWVFTNLLIATILIAPFIIFTSFVSKKQTLITEMIRFWAKWIIKSAGMKVSLHGLENIDKNQQYVILGNHESALDIMLVVSMIPLSLRLVAKIELRKIPLFGWAMERSLMPLVDRKNHRRAIKVMNETFDKLKENNLSVFVYPEGTRSTTGHLIPFKKGSFVLAIDHQLPILPVVMIGAGKINPPGTIWIKDTNIDIHFLKPVDVSNYERKDRTELRDKVFEMMDSHQRKYC